MYIQTAFMNAHTIVVYWQVVVWKRVKEFNEEFFKEKRAWQNQGPYQAQHQVQYQGNIKFNFKDNYNYIFKDNFRANSKDKLKDKF